jgi:hypothetical protein
MDFHAALDFQKPQGLSHGRMDDFVNLLAAFDFRINDADSMLEKRRQITACQVAVFVDCRREHRAAVLAIPGRIIRPPKNEMRNGVRLMIMS